MSNLALMNYLRSQFKPEPAFMEDTDAEYFAKEMSACLHRTKLLIDSGNHEKAMAEMKSLAEEIMGAV